MHVIKFLLNQNGVYFHLNVTQKRMRELFSTFVFSEQIFTSTSIARKKKILTMGKNICIKYLNLVFYIFLK